MTLLPEFYGSTTIGERGQVVLPAKLRNKFGMKKGDKFFVLGGKEDHGDGIFLVKAEAIMEMASKFFGKDVSKILASKR